MRKTIWNCWECAPGHCRLESLGLAVPQQCVMTPTGISSWHEEPPTPEEMGSPPQQSAPPTNKQSTPCVKCGAKATRHWVMLPVCGDCFVP
jgi:hypothetical protein